MEESDIQMNKIWVLNLADQEGETAIILDCSREEAIKSLINSGKEWHWSTLLDGRVIYGFGNNDVRDKSPFDDKIKLSAKLIEGRPKAKYILKYSGKLGNGISWINTPVEEIIENSKKLNQENFIIIQLNNEYKIENANI